MQGDIETILEALQAREVRYVVVGGVAVILHGHFRHTADLDLVIGFEEENIRKTLETLRGLGFVPRAPVAIEEFASAENRQSWIEEKGMLAFSLASPRFRQTEVDLAVSSPFDFEQALARATFMDLDRITVPVVCLSDLIDMKLGSSRAMDQEDVDSLKEIKRRGELSDGERDRIEENVPAWSYKEVRIAHVAIGLRHTPRERLLWLEKTIIEMGKWLGRAQIQSPG